MNELTESKEISNRSEQIIIEFAQKHINKFICSFSANGNQLSQWRGYCPKEGGYSIGFEKIALKGHFESLDQEARLDKCSYSVKEHHDALAKIFNDVNAEFSKKKRATKRDHYTAIGYLLGAKMNFFKHPAFHEENEWRLSISANESQTNYRHRDNYFVPYIKMEVPLDSVKEIIIGPSQDIRFVKETLIKRLKFYDKFSGTTLSESIKITPSEIPFKPMG